jgi:Zn-dependent M28 family amino/carboxypeptidase
MLAETIGERHTGLPDKLEEAAKYIEDQFASSGYQPRRQTFEAGGVNCANVEVIIEGTGEKASEIIVVGAHYDSAIGSPGANDNGSGVAALLELAGLRQDAAAARTVRFVAFTNEEPPYFNTPQMGSMVYAKKCRRNGDRIVGMLSLETMGYYSDEPGSQTFPMPLQFFYPSTGNFIGFVGDTQSGRFIHRVVSRFRFHASIPSEGAVPLRYTHGAGWSDHWSFWQEGYPAIMVTDTALFRYPHYHEPGDLPDQIDYDRLTLVVVGLADVLQDLLNPK